MHPALLVLALQLRATAVGAPEAVRTDATADSVHDARRAGNAQASFERFRRRYLPWEGSSGARCDARVGRFCWWYEENNAPPQPEAEPIVRARAELVALLDSLAVAHPGDDWLAGMRVHYRIEARALSAADSVARGCRATPWWCHALIGYAAHVRGDLPLADSAFALALSRMPEETRCEWRDIHTILPGDARGRYEALPCDARSIIERRYWLLSRPRLAARGNEWRMEFLARRVQSWLAARSVTPQTVSWGSDAEELLLRYGWPSAWGRVAVSSQPFAEPGIVGHDPSPSFSFGAREQLLDPLASAGDDGWEPTTRWSEARYAPLGVRRLAPVALQVARFRRGDSTLLAAAYIVSDDSLVKPVAQLAASLDDGRTFAAAPDSTRRGTSALMLPAPPRLVGVEVADSVSGTLARSRLLLDPSADVDGSRFGLSGLLLYRGRADTTITLESALARAIFGDTVGRAQPLGVFWETYDAPEGGGSVDVAVAVERIDRGFLRRARQRLGIEEDDAPLRMRWTDSRPAASGPTGRAISLDLGNLPPGRYRLTLSVTPPGGAAASSGREIELLDH
jgi:hypothetical protein